MNMNMDIGMDIMHPQGSYRNLPPENVFIALDEMKSQVGVATIEYQYQPHRSPERPVQLYFTLESQPNGWFILMGALLARARQLRDIMPDQPARMYTRVAPDNQAELDRYAAVGMNCNQFESLIGLRKLQNDPPNMMNFNFADIPLNTQQEQVNFLKRLIANDIIHIDLAYLQYLQRMPHFHALAMRYGQDLAGEIIVAGSGDSCELMAVYTAQPFRRRGVARKLINQCMNIMSAEGVERFAAVLSSISEPQKHLAIAFHGVDLQTRSVFPCLDL